MGITISVVIPVKNGSSTLKRCLQSIKEQTVADCTEIIILDSASTDNSVAIAAEMGVKVHPIHPQQFDHGLSRNEGTRLAKGDFIFFTVQDAFLSSPDLLEKMSRHFDDIAVMGVTGHQAVPHEKDKNPLLWFRRYSQPEVAIRQVDDPAWWATATQQAKQKMIAWDNVVAMYRKMALEQLPFYQTKFAEDWIWSRDALLKGWKLIYDPSLVVYHYHHQSYGYAYATTFTVNYHFYKFFDFMPVMPPLLIPLFKGWFHLLKHPLLTVKEKFYWMNYHLQVRLGEWFSNRNFLKLYRQGGMIAIENRYKEVCREIPQGKQNNKA